MDASGDPDFPNALNYRERNLVFQIFPIESNEYEALDANGWYFHGRTIKDVTHSISVLTSNAADSLHFIGGAYTYPGSYQNLQFPVSYLEDQWTINYEQNIDFELTVSSFALNKAPGQQSRTFTQVLTVVGEGTLRIPDVNGNPSQPFDALLIKSLRTQIDSTFINGVPAPTALLTSFGLTQGKVTVDSFYVMYASGFGGTVVSLTIKPNGDVSSLFYRPTAARLGGPSAIHDLEQLDFTCSPNPVGAGKDFWIKLDAEHSIHSVQILSLNGQLLHQEEIVNTNGSQISLSIPAETEPGIYLINLKDAQGHDLGSKKIVVN